jgi:hypothetical protein
LFQLKSCSTVGSHPTARSEQRWSDGPWARTGRAAEEVAVVIYRTGRHGRQAGRGLRYGHGPKEFFLSFVFTETVLIDFVQVFEQISYSFFYSKYSNENFV